MKQAAHTSVIGARLRVLLNHPTRLLQVALATNIVYALLFLAIEQRGFEESLWWGWVTAFTVGYGDISPVTAAGRGVAIANMATNFVLFQFLSARIVALVLIDTNVFDHKEQELLKQRAEEHARVGAENAAALRRIEERLGTLSSDAPPLPVFRTNEELLAKISS